jgi:hypothetical protein
MTSQQITQLLTSTRQTPEESKATKTSSQFLTLKFWSSVSKTIPDAYQSICSQDSRCYRELYAMVSKVAEQTQRDGAVLFYFVKIIIFKVFV